jgi:DNA topoisomerase-1
MKPAIISATNISLMNSKCEFRATAQEVLFDGYLKLYGDYESVPVSELPELLEGTKLQAEEVEQTQNFTKPPNRFTEARLIREMEECGIGRPSTYSQTISTIRKRKYVTVKEKKFIPTDQGKLTISKLDEFFNQIISVDYTARMETVLDDISEGKEDQTNIVSRFYNSFIPMVDNANKNMEKLAPKFTGEDCPKCGSKMVFRTSRYGTFEACSNYPKCKYIKQKETVKKEVVSTGIPCPKCGEGEIVERTAKSGRNKGKTFYACNNFPKCKNMIFGKPTGENCPKCGQLLMQDKDGNIACQDTKNCGYKE